VYYLSNLHGSFWHYLSSVTWNSQQKHGYRQIRRRSITTIQGQTDAVVRRLRLCHKYQSIILKAAFYPPHIIPPETEP